MNINVEVIKQQCKAFEQSGWTVDLIYLQCDGMEPQVIMKSPIGKIYRFSDLDTGVIMSQLAKLWVNTCKTTFVMK